MTNEEKIQELLNEPCWNSKPYLVGMDKTGVEDVMERFADWKDEQHEKEKQEWIEKAVIFLNERVCTGMSIPEIHNMIVDFRKSMGKESDTHTKSSKLCYDHHGNPIIDNML